MIRGILITQPHVQGQKLYTYRNIIAKIINRVIFYHNKRLTVIKNNYKI